MQQGAVTLMWGDAVYLTTWPNHVAANSENGATISASSTLAGSAPWQAHDGSSSTSWVSNTAGAGSWWQVRFASPRIMASYTVLGETGFAHGTTFDLQGSNDGSAWTTIDSGVNIGSGLGTVSRTITSRTPYVYFRATVTSTTDSGRIVEFTPTFVSS